jgi:2-dehydro-3-deoxyphosphooctonate aldolase (KDO 8-P synthase)
MMKQLNFKISNSAPLCLIAGPCVIESEKIVMQIADTLKKITVLLNINFIFKASFDKANRTSIHSFRGLGLSKGLCILEKVKKEFDIPVLTDVHEDTPLSEVASVVDVLQTPAFLCRQTNFMQHVAKAGLPVNIKKGQFLSPWGMKNVVEKMRASGNNQLMVCERGFVFGYHNLVVDMRSLAIMRETNCPVIFDASHSVQLPGSKGQSSGGQREFIPVLARAAVAAGIAGVFMETHPDPSQALSDGPNAMPLDQMRSLLVILKQLDEVVKGARVITNKGHKVPNFRHGDISPLNL